MTPYSRIAPIPRTRSDPKVSDSARVEVTGSLPESRFGRNGRVVSRFGDAVRDERRTVVGDQPAGLPDAEPRRAVADDPGTQRRPVAVELRQRVERLVHKAFRAVHAVGLRLVAGRDDLDVRALAPQLRLADVLGEDARVVG